MPKFQNTFTNAVKKNKPPFRRGEFVRDYDQGNGVDLKTAWKAGMVFEVESVIERNPGSRFFSRSPDDDRFELTLKDSKGLRYEFTVYRHSRFVKVDKEAMKKIRGLVAGTKFGF